MVLLLTGLVGSRAATAQTEPDSGYILDDRLRGFEFVHVPPADRYADVYFAIRSREMADDAGYTVAVIDRETFSVVETLPLRFGGRRMAPEAVDSDAAGTIYVTDNQSNVYRTPDAGSSWQQLDFDRQTESYVFGDADELSSQPLRTGGWYHASVEVNAAGHVLIHSGYGGARLTVFPQGASSAPLGPELSGFNVQSVRGVVFTANGSIILANSHDAYRSDDLGASYAPLGLPEGHLFEGASESGRILTWADDRNYVDGEVVMTDRGRHAYGNLSVTGDGLLHNFGAVNGHRLTTGRISSGQVARTDLNHNDLGRVESRDALFLFNE